MDDLFPPPPLQLTWKPAADRPLPAIFLQELVLLDTVAPYTPIRSIPFHPGLNIVWADPKLDVAKKGGSRLAGHSAGKSTLCRIIRWLLGEGRFGKEDLQNAVGTSFKSGLAALRLKIDGEPWVVGRGFWNSKEYWAVRGNSIEIALAHGVPEKHELPYFIAALDSVTIAPLTRHHLPGETENLHSGDLIPWLTRDQDCALQTVEAWREAPAKNIASKEARHILMRLVLDLLDDEEWKEMEVCAALETTKAAENKRKPELEGIAYASCDPLRFIVPRDGKSLHGELLVSKAEAQVAKRSGKLNALKRELDGLNVKEADDDYRKALSDRSKKEQEIATNKRTIKKLEKRISQRAADALETAQRRIDQNRDMPPGYCARKREEVNGLCKFYAEAPARLATHQAEVLIQRDRDHLQEQLAEEEGALVDLNDQLPFLIEREATLLKSLEGLRRQVEAKQREIALLDAEINMANAILDVARENFIELDRTVREIKDLTKRITKSNGRQSAIRKKGFPDRVDFSRLFESVLRYLMGENSNGYVEFDNSGLFKLIPKTRTTLSSAAIDAMAVVAFDLAAMFWSASGRGHHPRFLIHDSPRVADMSPVPYAAIFEVAHEAEKLGSRPPNFQYIITTTESPPDDLKAAHMILELDASTPNGRLFRRDF